MRIADRLLKIQVVCTEKLKHYIVLQRNLNTFIASIYMMSRKVLKRKNANSLLSMLWQR